jgi:catechol 2,3-dioxygenase-like lactoylglutathione lyase family enzyme
MTIEQVLAVVPVADITAASGWYEHLLGRTPDNRPMDTLIEWRVTGTGWLQVATDTARAGTAQVNFAVDDLTSHLQDLRDRDLAPGSIQDVNRGVQLASITDPDGNTITFLGNFRIHY